MRTMADAIPLAWASDRFGRLYLSPRPAGGPRGEPTLLPEDRRQAACDDADQEPDEAIQLDLRAVIAAHRRSAGDETQQSAAGSLTRNRLCIGDADRSKLYSSGLLRCFGSSQRIDGGACSVTAEVCATGGDAPKGESRFLILMQQGRSVGIRAVAVTLVRNHRACRGIGEVDRIMFGRPGCDYPECRACGDRRGR